MSTSAEPLRIALISVHTSPAAVPGSGDAGGMNVVIRQQAEVLAARGHKVEILTRRTSPESPGCVELAPGLTLRLLAAGPPEPVAKGAHENFIADFGDLLGAVGPYDIMHSHHWFSGMAALPVARASGAPHLQSFHSIAAHDDTPLSAGERPESPGRLAGEAWLARESDAVVTVSRAEAHTVLTRLGGSSKRTWVVPPGVDSTLFHPRDERHGPGHADSPGFAVVAGRLHPLKGFDLAIEAIAAVPENRRPDLVIAGEASADLSGHVEELTALAVRLGVGGAVRFIGPQPREEMAALLRRARLVLIPSHSETYGLVALEAAASGVPVIAAASGGLGEAVLDGETGLVLSSRNPKDWAAAITELVGNDDVADRLSRAARARAEELSWSRSADELLTVYRTVLGGAGDRPAQLEG